MLMSMAVKSPIYKWQDLQPSAGPHSEFFDFCDALEVKDGVSASARGWGLDHALAAWANHFKTVTIPDCKSITRVPDQVHH